MVRKKSGFTLIELLVVISIISILSLAAIVAYSTILKSSRDAKRQTDLKVIQSALESYFNDQKYYPLTTSVLFGSPFKSPNETKTYLNILPNDPDSSKVYSYESLPLNCDNTTGKLCRKYCIYADGESIPLMSVTGCTQDHTIKVTSP